MKTKKKYIKPELYYDGKKILFHSSREERLSLLKSKKDISKNEKFFSKKKYFISYTDY
jgi:hypothetical protein